MENLPKIALRLVPGALVLVALAVPAVARPSCRSAACVALKKVLAGRDSGFTPLRGAVLSRLSDNRPDEYAGKVKLPGARACTVEVVGASDLYLCIFPSEPYAKVIEQYNRVVAEVEQAIPANWATWQNIAPGRKGSPGPAKAFRAGPVRGQPVVEIVTLMPAKKLPHLALLVHQGLSRSSVAH